MSVFISYSSEISDFADLVRIQLENAGIQVWKDEEEIEAGKEWREEIDKALRNCYIVVVLLNQSSAKSHYVTYEWAYAFALGKTIIPILMEECEIHSRLEVLQYINFKGRSRPWTRLIDRIKKEIRMKTCVTHKTSDMTTEELEKLINSSKVFADKSAKSEGRAMQDSDVTEIANKIVSAKSFFETQQIKNDMILWVDDNKGNNTYERDTLELIGFKFDLASSTQDALIKMKTNKYVAIISDMERKEGANEGYVLLKEVRKTNKTIPYFIYTSSSSLEKKIEAQEKGALGLTNKPSELIDLITSYVQSI
jgi:CheY-like chemotaxis protein